MTDDGAVETSKAIEPTVKFADGEGIGKLLLGDYIIGFEFASILLLVALVGAAYLVRRAHLFAEPLEIAFRYDSFDDDGLAEESQTWSVKDRYTAGIRYSFFEDEELGVAAFAALEYRKTNYEISEALEDTAADESEEFTAKLGLSF